MDKFWLDIGEFFFRRGKFLLDMRFWLKQKFLGMGEFFFFFFFRHGILVGTNLWTWGNFC